jgi:hypothetical protein
MRASARHAAPPRRGRSECRINLNSLDDPEFVGWKEDDLQSLRSTSALMLEEIQAIVEEQLQKK